MHGESTEQNAVLVCCYRFVRALIKRLHYVPCDRIAQIKNLPGTYLFFSQCPDLKVGVIDVGISLRSLSFLCPHVTERHRSVEDQLFICGV